MDDKETKRKLNPLGEPVLDKRGDTPTAPVEVRKPLGKLISLRSPDWVRLKALPGHMPKFVLPPNPGARSLAGKEFLESVLSEGWLGTLLEVLRESELDLFLNPKILIPKIGELRLDAESELGIFRDQILRGIAPEASAVQEYGYWTIPFEIVALALVPCDSDPVDYQTGHLVLEISPENIEARFEAVQKFGADIDASRDAWLRAQVEPLIEQIDAQLTNASLPEGHRERLSTMLKDLIQQAYYRGIIETSEVATQLGVDESRVRQLAREGRLGMALSRHYVFSEQQLAFFASCDHPTGIHRTKHKN